mmetsp:Transcript_829/g.1847  ORF Transcript_829/g.1847 Transcript_829/m.1847 type:complete len:218 (+) Transcript_829:1106-1759(+)
MKLANSPPSMSSMTIMMYWAWEVPGLNASKHPRHSQMFGWPWICSRTSVSLRIDAIFSLQEGSISSRQIGMVLTACFVFGVLLLWHKYTVPWPPTPSTLSVSMTNGSSGGPKTLNCSIDPNARVIVLIALPHFGAQGINFAREKLQAKHKAAIPQDQSVDLSRHARKPPSAALCVQTLGCAGKGRFELREDTHLVGQMVPWKGVAMAQSCPSKTCAS